MGTPIVNLTLRFKDEAEPEFLDRFFRRSLGQMRFALILGIVLYALFGLLDAIAAPAARTQMWIIRYAIVCPMFAIGWALSYTPWFARYWQLVLTILPIVAGLGIIAMTVVAPLPVNYLYPCGLILVLMWMFTFIRLRFIRATTGAIIIVAAYLATAVIDGRTPQWIIVNNAFFLVTALILGGFAAFSIERYERNDFLQTREMMRTNTDLVESRRLIIESSHRAQLIFSALVEALPGTDLENKYRLEEKIGSGGFGTVYKARHLLLDAPVAVKVFRPVGGMSVEQSFERLRLEGISGKRIAHPNAVAVLDFGIASDAVAFLVMELLEGHTLADEIRAVGKMTPRRCAEIMVPVCSVLAEAHNNGIIHRDIKPGNIFLHQSRTVGEIVKVVDFGIAKLLEPSSAQALEDLTATGILIGTPAYIAPERLGSQAYGAGSDIYSVGVVMYQMLTGHVPHDSPIATLMQEPRPPREDAEMPAALNDIILQAMSFYAADRPTAAEMMRRIAEIFDMPVPQAPASAAVPRVISVEAPTDVREIP